MDLHLLIDNLSNPALLFFFLGIFASQVKSDLEIPKNSFHFICFCPLDLKGGKN